MNGRASAFCMGYPLRAASISPAVPTPCPIPMCEGLARRATVKKTAGRASKTANRGTGVPAGPPHHTGVDFAAWMTENEVTGWEGNRTPGRAPISPPSALPRREGFAMGKRNREYEGAAGRIIALSEADCLISAREYRRARRTPLIFPARMTPVKMPYRQCGQPCPPYGVTTAQPLKGAFL